MVQKKNVSKKKYSERIQKITKNILMIQFFILIEKNQTHQEEIFQNWVSRKWYEIIVFKRISTL